MEREISENLVILLVEDDKGHAALVQKNLWRLCVDAKIVHFDTGEKLLDYLRGQPHDGEMFESGRYIVLLDIKMPGIDGIETLRRVKEEPVTNTIPIIMLTTSANPSEISRSYDLGCHFYIVKPSDYNDFMQVIEHLGAFLSLQSLHIPQITV
ncbi:MAG: response regulator [Planctomycetota bacterium]|jgi:CheY-like chemotaxis protein